MIALCLVEYFRFSKKHRISLVCLGLGLSLAGNLLRTLLLIFLGAKLGMEQVNRWHDPAGLTVLIACFGGLWFYCFRHQNKALPPKQERPAAEPLLVRLPSISQGVTALVLFLGTEAMVQSWYRKAESVLPRRSALKVDWPQEASAYRTTPISYKVRSILRYSSGQAATWVDEKGTLWSMYHLQWNPGRASAHLARSHKPEVCLPAGGGTLKKYLGLHRIPVGDTALPFRAYEFEIEGHPFFVFHCLWEESTAREAVGVIELDARNRVDLVFRRERQLGQNLLQLGLAPKEVLPFEKVTEQVEALLKQRVVLERKAQPGSA
jgi:exosortase/archaeosortase family protein